MTRVRFTERTRPALDAATTSVEGPLGVTTGLPGEVWLGIVRPVLQPEIASSSSMVDMRTRWRGLQKTKPHGSSTASQTSCRVQGRSGGCSSTPARPVATVTEMVVVPPSAGADGLTVQVECAGTPAQVNVALPGSPATELSSNA